jgi:4-oxalomesaconate hydratase
VIGAHAADFVWRAGGLIAKHTAAGWEATVVALSYGERGDESGELWREEGQTVERVKQIRDAETRAAAEAVGATFVPYDLGDYPLDVPAAVERRLTTSWSSSRRRPC